MPSRGTSTQHLRNVYKIYQQDIFPLEMWRCSGMNFDCLAILFRTLSSLWSICCVTLSLLFDMKVRLPLRYGTFWRRFKTTWANILRFTPQSDHSTCDTCLDCKERFKLATESWSTLFDVVTLSSKLFWPLNIPLCSLFPFEDAQSKFETARFYKNHLANVSADRELEEWFQDWLPNTDFKTVSTNIQSWHVLLNVGLGTWTEAITARTSWSCSRLPLGH